jgi:hypothetical protein
LSQELFELFAKQLMNKGIIAKEGSMIDASFVDVPRQRNSKEDNADSAYRNFKYWENF